ncbi:MAG: molecular chaperone HtpG, partial [Gammaproteobacteria bacterium]
IPSQAPFDLWDRDSKHGVKLYVQRVFIMDGAEELMPRYLRFVRGVIDTNDLPLNVSREILQRNKTLDSIRGASVKKVLGMIESLAAGDDYASFWRAFGRVLKEGVIEDFGNRERIAKLLRFASTQDTEAGAVVGLDDYIGRMQEGQEAIYYITGDSLQTVRNSPHLEVFRARGIEVLLLDEPVDEWLVTHLTEYAEKPLKSVVDAELEAPAETADAEAAPRADEKVLERIKSALAERVADVRASRRLTDSPACLVSGGEQMSANLERLLRAAGQDVPETKRILELNLAHPLVRLLEDVADGDRFGNWAALLYEQSILAEGGRLDDPAGFVRRMNAMVQELAGQDA